MYASMSNFVLISSRGLYFKELSMSQNYKSADIRGIIQKCQLVVEGLVKSWDRKMKRKTKACPYLLNSNRVGCDIGNSI